jgi:hypothetical protein
MFVKPPAGNRASFVQSASMAIARSDLDHVAWKLRFGRNEHTVARSDTGLTIAVATPAINDTTSRQSTSVVAARANLSNATQGRRVCNSKQHHQNAHYGMRHTFHVIFHVPSHSLRPL